MPKILLVEDKEMSQDMLSRWLARRGYAIAIVADGGQGITTAQTQQPDLILIDMSMPVLDGWETIRQLKSEPATRAIPIIALTAHALAGDRERALAGCDDDDTKPVNLPRLLNKSRASLERRGCIERYKMRGFEIRY